MGVAGVYRIARVAWLASVLVAAATSATASAQTLGVVIVSPAAASTVSGNVAWNVAVDGKASRVWFSVDGTDVATDTAQPWGIVLDTRTLADGPHTLTATATANGGKAATATSSVQVTVANAALPPPPVPPANVSAPTISGQAVVGQQLSASAGTWTGTAPMTYAYQWSTCDSTGGCALIVGASATTYTPVSADTGHTLFVTVTAGNAAGSASASSQRTAAVTGAPGTSPLDFSGDWHLATAAGNLTRITAADYTYLLEESADRLQLVTSPLRRGGFAVKITVKQGDYEHNGSSERTELAANPVTYKPGNDFWVATSIYLDPTFPLPPSGGWALLHQFYGATGGQTTGSPPIALEVTPSGNFLLTVRGGVKSSSGTRAPKDVGHVIAPVTRGEWHDFLLHVRLAKDSTGIVEVWHRIAGGAFAVAPDTVDTGANVLTVAGVDQNVYPETGYYRSTDSRQAVLYSAGMWIRATRTQAEAFFG